MMVILCLALLLVGCFILCKADVTFDVLLDFKVDIANTAGLGATRIATTVDNEIDNILFEWDDPMRTPAFHVFYNFLFVTINPKSFVGTLTWDNDKTTEERKQAGGVVICRAVSEGSTLISNTFAIAVVWKPEPSTLTLEYTGDDIILGGSLTVRCSSPDKGNSPGEIKWIVDGDVKSGDRYNNEDIVIKSVEKTDAGEWKCYYGNDVGNGKESERKTVEVKWIPEPSSLTLEYTGDDIILGSSLILSCSSSDKGNPPGQVTWIVDGDIKSGGRYNTKDIVINPVEKTDAGEWKCYYGNDIGMGTESETNTIDVKRPPGAATLVIDGVDDYSVKQGQQIKFRCIGDTGNPLEQVVWIFDKVINKITSTTHRIFNSGPRHNGTWSCMFMNLFGNGTVSQGVTLTVLLTPLPPIMELITYTTISLTISIKLMSDTNTAMESYHMNMNITLVGNNTSVSVIQPAAIEEYTFYNLEPWTTYNISVFYNNDAGDGEAVLQTFTTKKLPVLKTPIVTRSFLDAGVKMTIENPDSTNKITIVVCQIGETDSNKCNVETVEEITEGDINKRIYASFSNRIVNVSMYDNGVPVYAYGDEIGPAVVVIVLIALTGVVLFVGIIVISIVVIKKRSEDDSTLKENNVQYENVAQDTRLNEITNAALNPEYEDVSPIGTTNGCNSDNTTYMGLDQTDVQRTRDRPTELTVYQSLN